MKLIRQLILTSTLSLFGMNTYAVNAPKPPSISNGTVTGTMSYASLSYWIASGKENICINYDAADDAILIPLNGKKVVYSGAIETSESTQKGRSTKSRCITVGPNNYPKEVK